MQYILLLCVMTLTGCASVPLEQLTAEARECVKNKAIENSLEGGLVVEATQEQHEYCWIPVNEKVEAMEKREKKRKDNESPCGQRLINWCDWTGCRCVTSGAVQDAMNRARRY